MTRDEAVDHLARWSPVHWFTNPVTTRCLDRRASWFSWHQSALQISSDRYRPGVRLLQLGDRFRKWELTDVAHDEPLGPDIAGNLPHNRRRRMEGTGRPSGNRQVHDQDICTFREHDERGIGAVLIGAEYNRPPPRIHTIGERRNVAVRNSLRRDLESLMFEHCRWALLGHVDYTDLQRDAASGSLACADGATEHGKGAHFFIEEAAEK